MTTIPNAAIHVAMGLYNICKEDLVLDVSTHGKEVEKDNSSWISKFSKERVY